MSTALNERDAVLQAASVRIINPKNASILMSASTSLFHLNAAGAVDVLAITITATLVGLEGDVTFTADGAALTSVTGKTAVVRYEDMQGPAAIVTARIVAGGQAFSQSCIIGVVRDGATGGSASVLVLTPSQHVFKINKDGTNSPASITLTAAGQNLGGTPSFTIPVGTATLSAGANSMQKILTFANMATDVVTIQVEQGGVSDRVTIVKLREGVDGVNALTGFLSNEAHTLPANSDGLVTSATGATTYMQVFQGIVEDTSNWTFSASPASNGATGLAYEWLNFNTLRITGMAAGVDAASLSITASKAGMPAITKQFSISKSRAGQSITGARGAGQYYAGGSAWSDGVADAVTPGDNVVNDVVTISNGGTFAMTKRWDGAAWNEIGAVFDGSLFVTGSINGASIRAGTLDIRASDGRLLLGANGDFGGIVKASNLQVGVDQSNLILDPRFKDLPWWGLVHPANTGVNTGVTPVDWNGTAQQSWPRGNVSMYFQSTGGVQYNTETKRMPLIPGATYLIEYDLLFHNDWDGDFSVWFHVNNWTANLMGGLGLIPDSPYKFADGNGIQYPAYTREWRRVSTVITIPTSIPSATEGSFLFLRSIRSGSVEMGSFNLIRLIDSVLIKDGAITANKISVNSVQAVSAVLGDIQLGPNGALHQGTNAYNSGAGIYYGAPGGVPKFFAGTAGGANIRWSPEEGLRVDQASLDTFGAWFTGNAGGGSYPNGSAGYGFLQVNTSGGKAPYTYYWTLTETMRTGNVGRMYMSSQGQASNTFGGDGSNGTLSYALSCTVVDANQRAITLGTEITVNHGTPI